MAGERILAVDDEIFYRTFYNNSLSSEGHIVYLAESARIALSALARERFDLVIVDYVMEGISNPEFLEAVRKRDPFLPVVVAGPPNVHEALIALRTGAVDYLNKPFVAEEFRSSVQSILDRAKALRGSVCQLV
jgi:DNA-binding NtrC family response regulator